MRVLMAMLLSVMISVASAADHLITKTITVNYLKPADVEKAVKPLLQKNESVSTLANKLIVNVSPDTLTRIRKVIQSVDKPPVVFQISFHQDDNDWLNQMHDSEVFRTSAHSEKGFEQSLQVMSGEMAFVSTGTDFPVVSNVGYYGGAFFWGPSVSYDRVTTNQGIYIFPELQGAKVKLKVRRVGARMDRFNNQVVHRRNIDTTTLVPIGRWIKIGAASETANDTQRDSITFEAGGEFQDKGSLYLKIDSVKKS